MPERAGVTSLVGKNHQATKIAGDNVNHGSCDSRDYFASPSLIPQIKFNRVFCTENVSDFVFFIVYKIYSLLVLSKRWTSRRY